MAVDEHAPGLRVGLQRLRLAAAAVERQHELAGEPLAGRVVRDELRQLSDERVVTPGGEVGLDACVQSGEPLLVEASDLGRGERLVGEVCQRRSAP